MDDGKGKASINPRELPGRGLRGDGACSGAGCRLRSGATRVTRGLHVDGGGVGSRLHAGQHEAQLKRGELHYGPIYDTSRLVL